MMPLQRPVRVGRFEPEIADAVVRWGPVSIIMAPIITAPGITPGIAAPGITARIITTPIARQRIVVEDGMVVATLFRKEPRC